MLVYLRITDFSLLDDIEISLGPGMTVFTGETGAGKSMLMNAVSLLRGGRASSDMVRAGRDEARVEAIFAPPPGTPAFRDLGARLQQIGVGTGIGEDGLLVRRVVSKSGRNRAYLAGEMTTVGALSEVCGSLIDISGQHEHQTLLEVGRHLRILDHYGVDEALLAEMAEAYELLRARSAALKAASIDEQTRISRAEFLRFQLDELEGAGLCPGEDERLRGERDRLRGVERILGAARHAEERLYSGEPAVCEVLAGVMQRLGEVSALDGRLAGLAAQIREAETLLADAADGLRRYAEGISADPERLQEIEDRLHLISRILRKHGPDVATALRRKEEMAEELSRLLAHEAERERAERALGQAQAAARRAAERLSAARAQAAVRLGEEASRALLDLSMPAARLMPRLEGRLAQKGDDPALLIARPGAEPLRLGRDGFDRCELLLAANPGEEARPLQRIASGGELSRVMLALKGILGQADGISTYVFDELDTGIGGPTADRVGRRIRQLSQEKQVLCITHLPQIAVCADHHFLVEKESAGGRARTLVRALGKEERREEIARMLGGARVTQRTRAHAAELLREAK